jgi:signal transduction histidine kinase
MPARRCRPAFHLLQRLLDLARADMAVAPEDCATPLEPPAARRRRRASRPKGSISRCWSPNFRRFAAPAALIEAVVETLVENSRQAGASAVSISAQPRAPACASPVSDNGPGVPAADHERSSSRSTPADVCEGGSGLGLSIARSLLAACGGPSRANGGEGRLLEWSFYRGR